MNLFGGILNSSDNFDDQKDYWFIGLFFKIDPIVIDDYTKKKFVNMQLEHLRPQRNIDNIVKKSDEIYKINMTDDMESDEGDEIGENKDETINTEIKVL